MSRYMLIPLLALLSSLPALAETTKTWEGSWNNRKYGTKGPLKCVAKEVKSGTWKGTFTGTFQGDPFTYEATFEAKPAPRQGQFNLSGKATIRGHKYQWTGMLRGTTLNGKYTSSVGYYGEFTMKEKRPR